MIIEFAIHDLEFKEIDVKNLVIEASKYQPDSISVHSYYVKAVKKTLNHSIDISCPIDYPLGRSDLQTRQTEIISSIKNGVSRVDVVIPILYLVNSKYEKFREDIKSNIELCSYHNIDIRYMLEYRIFNHTTLTKIANILTELGIRIVYASTGYMLDDILDNTIASTYLAKNTGIKTIINGNMWHKDQIKNILSNKPYGLRFKNIHSLHLINEEQTSK